MSDNKITENKLFTHSSESYNQYRCTQNDVALVLSDEQAQQEDYVYHSF